MGLAPRHAPLRLGLSYFAPKSSRQPANRNEENKRQSNCPPAKESSARAERPRQEMDDGCASPELCAHHLFLSSLKARHVNRSLRRSDRVEPSHLYALLGA